VNSQDCSNLFLPGIGSQQMTLENKVQFAKNKREKIAQQEFIVEEQNRIVQMVDDILDGVDYDVEIL
jgi:hypothetical protein